MTENKSTKIQEETATEDDDDLYAVITPAKKPGSSKPSSSSSLSRGKDDDLPFHKIEFIHDVPLSLSAEIGQTTLSVRELLALTPGNIIEFTKVVGEPMDITISGRLMARGEIVVVNERYGVRISEVTRPDEAGAISSRDT